jgi:glycerol kinase
MQSVYLVPAFVGLGALLEPNVRGAVRPHPQHWPRRARPPRWSVCHQTYDLREAMRADWPSEQAANNVLRVDGGMTASDWTMQRLADLDAPVDRPMIQETTALGAASAGLQAGVTRAEKFADNWRLERR